MWIPGVREQVSRTLKELGYAPIHRGGNGQLTEPQIQMLLQLGAGWYPEWVVPTGHLRPDGIPKHLKIDIANPEEKIAIELDGVSHHTYKKRRADKRKVAFLLRKGWSVLHLSNAKALSLCSTCKSRDTLLTTLMGFLHITVT